MISYNDLKGVFVAWNAHIHNHIHINANKLTLTAYYPKEGVCEDEIKCVYTYRNMYGNEKIAFIGVNALYTILYCKIS